MMSEYTKLAEACGGSINLPGLMALGVKIHDDPRLFDAELVGEYYQYEALMKEVLAPLSPEYEDDEC